MELRGQPARPTLAQKLGDVTHISPLLRKVRELSGCAEEQTGDWLLELFLAAQPKLLKLASGISN